MWICCHCVTENADTQPVLFVVTEKYQDCEREDHDEIDEDDIDFIDTIMDNLDDDI